MKRINYTRYAVKTKKDVKKAKLPIHDLKWVIFQHNQIIGAYKRIVDNHPYWKETDFPETEKKQFDMLADKEPWTEEMFFDDIVEFLQAHPDKPHYRTRIYSPLFGYGTIASITPENNIRIWFEKGTTKLFDRYGRYIDGKDSEATKGSLPVIYPYYSQTSLNDEEDAGFSFPENPGWNNRTKVSKTSVGNLISKDKALARLGISEPTLQKYIKEGILNTVVRNKYTYFYSGEIDMLVGDPTYGEVNNLTERLEALRRRLREDIEVTGKYLKDVRGEFLAAHRSRLHWLDYREIIRAAIMAAGAESCSERELEIINAILDLKTKEEIADHFGLSYERIRQIFIKTIRKLIRFGNNYKEQKETLAQLKEKYETQQKTIEALKTALETKELEDTPGLTDDLSAQDIVTFQNTKPFSDKLKGYGISTRAHNCLRAADIETIGELVSFRRDELLKITNMGRKTIDELELLLEHKGLLFDMWRDPNRDYVTFKKRK